MKEDLKKKHILQLQVDSNKLAPNFLNVMNENQREISRKLKTAKFKAFYTSCVSGDEGNWRYYGTTDGAIFETINTIKQMVQIPSEYEFYIMDIGGGPGTYLLNYINIIQSDMLQDFFKEKNLHPIFYLINLNGDQEPNQIIRSTNCIYFHINNFQIENMSENLKLVDCREFTLYNYKRGRLSNWGHDENPFDEEVICGMVVEGGKKIGGYNGYNEIITHNMHGRVNLINSTYCFMHLIDPMGTFIQAFNLLRPKLGILSIKDFFPVIVSSNPWEFDDYDGTDEEQSELITDSLDNIANVVDTDHLHLQRFIYCLVQSNEPFCISGLNHNFITVTMLRTLNTELQLPIMLYTCTTVKYFFKKAKQIAIYKAIFRDKELESIIDYSIIEDDPNCYYCKNLDIFKTIAYMLDNGSKKTKKIMYIDKSSINQKYSLFRQVVPTDSTFVEICDIKYTMTIL